MVSCCAMLALALGGHLIWSNSAEYGSLQKSYFSNQEAELSPACVVTPSDAEEVSQAIRILNSATCQQNGSYTFAVRSGGHMAWAGSANINDGVTLDLSLLNNVSYVPDSSSALVGPGARWEDVYSTLDRLNTTVVGGRASQVGVGGLALGGGISYLSPRYGFVCDNIVSFELVLASGAIVNASQTQNTDLWKALKGGLNNFGVVTKFEMMVYVQNMIFGGSTYSNISTANRQLSALYNFTASQPYDEFASVIQSFGFNGGSEVAVVNSLVYTKPVSAPASLEPFIQIPQLDSTLRYATVGEIAQEQGSFSTLGHRELYTTTTFRNNLGVLNEAFAAWNETRSQLARVPGIVWSLSFEPIPQSIVRSSTQRGGNSLGLLEHDGPLMIAALTATWSNASDDTAITNNATLLIDKINLASELHGVPSRYRYLNYASALQRPIDGYGQESKMELRRVSSKYDPQRFFQDRLSGKPGFKLWP